MTLYWFVVGNLIIMVLVSLLYLWYRQAVRHLEKRREFQEGTEDE